MYGNQGASVDSSNTRQRVTADECSGSAPGYASAKALAGRAPIHFRIERALENASAAVQRANAAGRAREILAKYPEFGELLDLLDQF